jgi:hypothetical protein
MPDPNDDLAPWNEAGGPLPPIQGDPRYLTPITPPPPDLAELRAEIQSRVSEIQRNLMADDGKYTSHGTPHPIWNDPAISRVAWRDPHDLAELLGDSDRDERLQAGIDQIANAMMDAEDRAAETPNVPAVDVYRTPDESTMLRVEVLVEDESTASGYDENDLRDANRPFIPLAWRNGGGVVKNLYPVEIHDAGGNLLGAWAAGELQITYHFEVPDGLRLPLDRNFDGRTADEVLRVLLDSNQDRFYTLAHEGFDPNWPCELCGKPVNDGRHDVTSDDTSDRRLIIVCNHE